MENKSKSEELLCEVYRNVKMGEASLCQVSAKIDDKFMLKAVTGQIGGYASLAKECEEMMKKTGVKPKRESALKRVATKSGIALNTLFDDSDSHIAEMICRGTNMGADHLEAVMHRSKRFGASEDTVALCENVVKFERGAAGAMKDYL